MRTTGFLLLAALFCPTFAFSSELTLMPISLDIVPPKVQDHFTIRNGGNEVIKMQVRVFRWEQRNGKSYYTPTKDVVVSPPFPVVRPDTDTVIRVIRTSKAPINGEESYRVFFDELPRADLKSNESRLSILTRQTAPVFFRSEQRGENKASWQVKLTMSGFQLIGRNSGNSRMKVSDVILLHDKTVVGRKTGLVGYVLSGSDSVLEIPRIANGTPNKLRLLGEFGAVEEDISVIK